MTPLTTTELPGWVLPVAAGVAAVLVLLALAVWIIEAGARRRAAAEIAALRGRVAALEGRSGLDTVAARPPRPTTAPEFVITSIDQTSTEPEPGAVTKLDLSAPAFADAVLRESAVHTASFLHGVRKALSSESRDRIAFEMRREVKRSRKGRRTEVKEALREYRARHRAAVAPEATVGEEAR